ncbi:MAG: hypothetical protein CVU40_05865 [Chloroflexi bacterium HGW-Chloroflexi-2]|jgi:uncharacterized protein with HEPN domain|nr:MAG: hypothetical protein CVU40_05865 [Chloroflexi bacterium HGW-Chloroflexi-2]
MDKTNSFLYDIKIACDRIQQFIEGMDLTTFSSDLMCQDAVIRRIEIIGEASAKIDPSFQENHPEIPWHRMRGMRNRLIHDYNEIDIELVWQTIQVDIPDLKKKIESLLDN